MNGRSSVAVPEMTDFRTAITAAPASLARIFLRPYPWEASGMTSQLVIENAFIVFLFVWYCRQCLGAIRMPSNAPHLVFLLVFTAEVVFLLTSIPNLGLLSRQRAMLVPFAFALLFSVKLPPSPPPNFGHRAVPDGAYSSPRQPSLKQEPVRGPR